MRRGITCAALVVAISAAPGAGAQTGGGVLLEWSRGEGAEQCIAQADLAARVEARLGRPAFALRPPADTTIEGSIERAQTSPRWRGTLRVTRADHATESREIVSDAPTCRPLSNAMALVLSLLVAPIAPPDPNPGQSANPNPGQPPNLNPGQPQNLNPGRIAGRELNPGRVEVGQRNLNPGRVEGAGTQNLNPGRVEGAGTGRLERSGNSEASRGLRGRGGTGQVNLGRSVVGRPWGWGIGVGSVLQTGALPGLAFGPRAVGRVVAPLAIPVSLELQGVWLVGPEAVVTEGRADFTLLLAGVALCPQIVGGMRLRAGACAGLDLGRVLVRGDFAEKSFTQRELYGQAVAGGWISLRIHRWLSAGASADAVVPLLRHDFEWEEWKKGPTHELHHTGPLAGQLEIHVGAEFP